MLLWRPQGFSDAYGDYSAQPETCLASLGVRAPCTQMLKSFFQRLPFRHRPPLSALATCHMPLATFTLCCRWATEGCIVPQ